MNDSDAQDNAPTPKPQQTNQTLIVVLLCIVALLLVGVAGMFFYQHQQTQQLQRMQTAIAYFDKIEQEEKALAEQERLKAEQEKLKLALEEARAEAKREAEKTAAALEEQKAAVREAAARKASAQQETYNPCEHVYVGKVYQVEQLSLFGDTFHYDWTVLGFSSSSGKASVRSNETGSTDEIYCSQIPN